MIIKINNDRSNETVFTAFRNVDGAGSITVGMPVCTVVSTAASVNGINATNAVTANFPGFSGLARTSVAINGYGLATSWGMGTSVWISNETTSITITVGDPLILVTGLGIGMSSTGGATIVYTQLKYCVAGATMTLSQGQAYGDNPIVRCL